MNIRELAALAAEARVTAERISRAHDALRPWPEVYRTAANAYLILRELEEDIHEHVPSVQD